MFLGCSVLRAVAYYPHGSGYALVVIASDAGVDRLCRPFILIICVTLWTWKQ